MEKNPDGSTYPTFPSTHVSSRSSRSRHENGFSFALSRSFHLPLCLLPSLSFLTFSSSILFHPPNARGERTVSLIRHALITYLDADERNLPVRHMFQSHCARSIRVSSHVVFDHVGEATVREIGAGRWWREPANLSRRIGRLARVEKDRGGHRFGFRFALFIRATLAGDPLRSHDSTDTLDFDRHARGYARAESSSRESSRGEKRCTGIFFLERRSRGQMLWADESRKY